MILAANRRLFVCLCFSLAGFSMSACSEHSTANASTPSSPATPPVIEGRVDSSPLPAEHYDSTAQIDQLKELRDKGLITDAEFQQKKKLLLERQ